MVAHAGNDLAIPSPSGGSLKSLTPLLASTQIPNRVWACTFDPGSNVVDVYVSYLRRKLNRPGLVPLLQTVRGVGHRLLSGDAEPE